MDFLTAHRGMCNGETWFCNTESKSQYCTMQDILSSRFTIKNGVIFGTVVVPWVGQSGRYFNTVSVRVDSGFPLECISCTNWRKYRELNYDMSFEEAMEKAANGTVVCCEQEGPVLSYAIKNKVLTVVDEYAYWAAMRVPPKCYESIPEAYLCAKWAVNDLVSFNDGFIE